MLAADVKIEWEFFFLNIPVTDFTLSSSRWHTEYLWEYLCTTLWEIYTLNKDLPLFIIFGRNKKVTICEICGSTLRHYYMQNDNTMMYKWNINLNMKTPNKSQLINVYTLRERTQHWIIYRDLNFLQH